MHRPVALRIHCIIHATGESKQQAKDSNSLANKRRFSDSRVVTDIEALSISSFSHVSKMSPSSSLVFAWSSISFKLSLHRLRR